MRRPIPADRWPALTGGAGGLTTAEAAKRRARYGANNIVETAPAGWKDLLRDTARDPMIWFLLGASGLFAFIHDYPEAVVLLFAIVPLAGMDAFLHRRTRASTQGLSSRLASEATVIRDGVVAQVPSVDVVPGDRVLVSSGQAFPADGILYEAADAQADESVLTGEAYPVRKRAWRASLPSRPAAIDVSHWGLAGTRLLTGQAVLLVVFTGAETRYGEIVRSAVRGAHARTPLQRAIANLVSVLLVAAAILCVALAWIRFHQGFGLVDALLSAVTLAVAALPEEFPVVFSFFLGVGVYRMARRHALVQRAVAVENIGRVSCICSDKTGTLTEGRLRLTHLFPADGVTRQQLHDLASLASRADSGDPMDGALTEGAPRASEGLSHLKTYPFTEDRRRETALFERQGGLLAAVKGAPETVLPMCAMTQAQQAQWSRQMEELAAAGHKVIACAWREFPDQTWSGGEPERDLQFAGLLAFEDPVREGVPESIERCRRAGVRVIMITGDHPDTARAVARQIGLGHATPRVASADDFIAQTSREDTVTGAVDVIARAVPSQKLDLVRRLQAAGETVAVTGDGVNDVPALQAADIGIAMGERGTRSAREVAAIVLLDDNFRTIVRAIAEGHQLFRNLRMSFAYLLMIHIPLVVTAALIPLAGYPLLYRPIHIVWLELIIHPTALLVFQNVAPGEEIPRLRHRRESRFFGRTDWLLIAVVGTLVTLVIIAGYVRSLGTGGEVQHARAMALVALTMASATVTLGLTGLHNAGARITVALTIASSILLVQTPLLSHALHLTPLHGDDWGIAAMGGALAGALSALIRSRSADPRRRTQRPC